MRFFLIDEGQLRVLKRVQSRLHTEDRLGGDEMRDLGHALESIVRVVEQLEQPSDVIMPDDFINSPRRR